MKHMWSEEEILKMADAKNYLHNISLFGSHFKKGYDFSIRLQFYSSSKRRYTLDEIKFLATHENILTTGELEEGEAIAGNKILSAQLIQWDNEYFSVYCCEYKDSSGTLAFEEIKAIAESISVEAYSVCNTDTLEYFEYL